MSGVIITSIGSYAFIIIGMPWGRQYHDGTFPGPPSEMSARFSWNTFMFYGVSGGCSCPMVQRGTKVRTHWPLMSGYLEISLESSALAPDRAVQNAKAQSAAT